MAHIETISAATYERERAICDKAAAYAESIMAGQRNYLTKEEAAHPDYAACNNEMRGRVEQYELLRDLPESLVAYISDGKATVWTGLPVGDAWISGDGWRCNGYYTKLYQVYALIGGMTYTGRGQGDGMCVSLRLTADSKRRKAFADANADEMTRHYVAAMLWSTTDESTPDGGEPMDSNYDDSDLSPDFAAKCRRDCWLFLYRAMEHIRDENYIGRSSSGAIAMAGHDFWLTRVGHGAGFWDGDWKSDKSAGLDGPLSRMAKHFGGVDPYVTDSGEIAA